MTPIGCLAAVLLLQAVPPPETPSGAGPAAYTFTIIHVSAEGLTMKGGPGIWGELTLGCAIPCTIGIDWTGGWAAQEREPAKPADFQVFRKNGDTTEFTCRARRCTLKAAYHSGFTENVTLRRDEALRFTDVFQVEVSIER